MNGRENREKGVVLCEQCREVYSVWVRPDGGFYAISSYNACTCDERNISIIEDV